MIMRNIYISLKMFIRRTSVCLLLIFFFFWAIIDSSQNSFGFFFILFCTFEKKIFRKLCKNLLESNILKFKTKMFAFFFSILSVDLLFCCCRFFFFFRNIKLSEKYIKISQMFQQNKCFFALYRNFCFLHSSAHHANTYLSLALIFFFFFISLLN